MTVPLPLLPGVCLLRGPGRGCHQDGHAGRPGPPHCRSDPAGERGQPLRARGRGHALVCLPGAVGGGTAGPGSLDGDLGWGWGVKQAAAERKRVPASPESPPGPLSPGDSQDVAAERAAPSSAADRRVHAGRHHHLRAPRPGAGWAAGRCHERRGGRHLSGQGAQREVGHRYRLWAARQPPPPVPAFPAPSPGLQLPHREGAFRAAPTPDLQGSK